MHDPVSASLTRDVTPAQAADVAEQAAQLLEDDGWCQRTAKDRDGRHCILGALADAGARLELGYVAAGRHIAVDLVTHLGLPTSPDWIGAHDQTRLMDWNDEPDRTADDVIWALRHSAKRLRDLP